MKSPNKFLIDEGYPGVKISNTLPACKCMWCEEDNGFWKFTGEKCSNFSDL